MMRIRSKQWKHLIYSGAEALGIHMDQEKIDQFVIHARELVKWNQKVNLTAITNPQEIAVKHFIDSIAPAPLIPPNVSLLDIGSGGGFPGIPLKILLPSLSVTLIDASRKKVSFLKHLIRILALNNTEAHHARAEDLSRNGTLANSFDVVITRALSSMDAVFSTALPLLVKGGKIIAMKGKTYTKIDAVHSIKNYLPSTVAENKNHFTLTVKKYTLPFLTSERCLVIFEYGGSCNG
jgi:16S rRNA (guanine527-N7)-methyltransferase